MTGDVRGASSTFTYIYLPVFYSLVCDLVASVDTVDYRLLEKMKDVLPLNTSGNLILRGTRVVAPKTLQRHAVKLTYEDHQGLVKPSRCCRGKFGFRTSTSG